MARAYTPPFSQRHAPGSRRVMSIGELQKMYGKNARIELQGAPQPASAESYLDYAPNEPDEYEVDEDPVEVPVRRSPWIPAVLLIMLGVGAFLGYALYRKGWVATETFRPKTVLQITASLPAQPVNPVWKEPHTLPRLTNSTAAGSAGPSNDSTLGATNEIEESADSNSDARNLTRNPDEANLSSDRPQRGRATARGSAAQSKPNARNTRRGTSEDDQATLELIQRERERLERSKQAPAHPGSESDADNPYRSTAESDNPYSEASPPGYIEAETK